MDKITVLVLADPAEPELATLNALRDTATVVIASAPEAFERSAPEADVIFNWSASGEVFERVWRMARRVRWVHLRSAGLDGLLFPELVESPVPLTNARGVFSEVLGEFVLGAVLFFAKDFRRMVASQTKRDWDQFDIAEIRGQSMGIVGFGDIGRAVASRAHALGMRILALRRNTELSASDPCVARVFAPDEKQDLLAQSDYVVVVTPLTPATRGMIGEPELQAMRPGAVLINIGRGPVVDEAALVRALEQKRIRGAALDVFDEEPLPAGHPFYRLDNLLLSPHCADHTPDWKTRAMRLFVENFERFLRGDPLVNIVDKRRGY